MDCFTYSVEPKYLFNLLLLLVARLLWGFIAETADCLPCVLCWGGTEQAGLRLGGDIGTAAVGMGGHSLVQSAPTALASQPLLPDNLCAGLCVSLSREEGHQSGGSPVRGWVAPWPQWPSFVTSVPLVWSCVPNKPWAVASYVEHVP